MLGSKRSVGRSLNRWPDEFIIEIAISDYIHNIRKAHCLAVVDCRLCIDDELVNC